MAKFIISAFFIIFTILIIILLQMHLKNKKVSCGIINHDDFSMKYVYKINLTKEQIINRLKLHNSSDELDYTIDTKNSVIIFKGTGVTKSYTYEIREYNEYSILQINQKSLLPPGSTIFYFLNPFWVRKLDAEIVPFSQYGI